jgi:hypothetical protein
MARTIDLIVSTATIGTLQRAGITGTIVTTVVPSYVCVTVTTDQFPLIQRIAKTVTSGIIWKVPTNINIVTDNVTGPTVTTAPHWINGLIDAICTIDADGTIVKVNTTGIIRNI